jgi:hypothetical protein
LVKLVAKECDIELELDRKGNLKHIKANLASQGAPFCRSPPIGYALCTRLRSTPRGSIR